MNEQTPIVVEADAESVAPPTPIEMALTKHTPQQAQVTAAQAKVEAIADLTHSAYQKAATLKLTKEESDALLADFPDEAFRTGAAGKDNLIYIEHAFLRDRFTQVFGMGQWAIISRRSWSEQFTTQGYPGKPPTQGERVYVEAMLVVRGCFVGEAIGAMEYYPKNAAQNYGDAVEGAKTAAFRRCAKEFGVGLQAWKKDWCQGWMDRKMGRKPSAPPTVAKSAPTPPAPEQSKLEKFLLYLKGYPPEQVLQFCIDLAWLMPNEALDYLDDRFLPKNHGDLKSFKNCLDNWIAKGDLVQPYDCPIPDPKAKKPVEVPRDDGSVDYEPEGEEAWRQFPMPFGKNAGTVMEELPKNYLFGLWANYTVETEYNGKPKKPETIAKDTTFREMLDACGEHYGFKKKD